MTAQLRKAKLIYSVVRKDKVLNFKLMEDNSLLVSLGGQTIQLTPEEVLSLKVFLDTIKEEAIISAWKKDAERYNEYILKQRGERSGGTSYDKFT